MTDQDPKYASPDPDQDLVIESIQGLAAGTILVPKIACAAAASGTDLADITAEAKNASSLLVGTMGVALPVCTLPGQQVTSDRLGTGKMEPDVGIHGKPGAAVVDLQPLDTGMENIIAGIGKEDAAVSEAVEKMQNLKLKQVEDDDEDRPIWKFGSIGCRMRVKQSNPQSSRSDFSTEERYELQQDPPPPPQVTRDQWTYVETATLIEEWGSRFLQRNRKNLKANDWQEITAAVGSKNLNQCRNKVGYMKGKYWEFQAEDDDTLIFYHRLAYFIEGIQEPQE